MSSIASSVTVFDAAAERTLRRVLVRRWLRVATETVKWAAGAALAALVMQALGIVGAWLPVLVVTLWLGVSGALAWRTRPGRYEALALWDEVRRAHEAFASAWWYGSQPERTAMQQRHVEAQQALLEKALPGLAKDLPLPLNRWLWLVPALALTGVVGGLWHKHGAREERLTPAMRQAAAGEAKSLARTDLEKKHLQGLTPQEKQETEKLQQNIQNTAHDLEAEGSQSARDVLNNLEARAREAEKLAKKLGTDKDAWASEKLIAELRKHADTADLGDAVASRNAAQSAKTAGDLASQLKAPQPPAEFRERLREALKDVCKQSEEADSKRVVGAHVLGAGGALEASDAPGAARHFDQLAEEMQNLARREQSQKELEKLAQQLRDAGSRITGNQGGGLQQMAGADAGKNGQGQAQGQGGQQQQGQQGQAQAMNQAPLQAPGFAQSPPPGMMQEAPEASAGQQQQMSMAQAQPGQEPPPQGKPLLIAPVPGMKMDKPPSPLITGPKAPKDGDGPSITLSVPGGPQAGQGTAKLEAPPTTAQKAGRDSQVNAARGSEGQSSSRAVEGGIRQDAPTLNSRQMAVDFIKQEEAALDDAALPPARREQVRRYFTELRKRFEAQEK